MQDTLSQNVTNEEYNELKSYALKIKNTFIDSLKDKEIKESLNNYNSQLAVSFISDAKLLHPSHKYRMSFVRRATVQTMIRLLEQEINDFIKYKYEISDEN